MTPETPPRYRCQPELDYSPLIQRRATELGLATPDELPEWEHQVILDWLKPVFSAITYGQPGYGQLSERCTEVIRSGAERGTEMGVFNSLNQPQLKAQLRSLLADYLPYPTDSSLVKFVN